MTQVNGNKIREVRKSLGYSQDVLAEKLGVSKVTICWYENGERTPSLENFLKLSEILNLSLDELVGREVSIVASSEEEYKISLAKKDIEIIRELKTRKNLYKKLYNNPKRTIDLIERKVK